MKHSKKHFSVLKHHIGLGLLCCALSGTTLHAMAAPPVAASSEQVIASGTVPDESTKSAILAKLRELYGASRVVDNIGVGSVIAPPNWSSYVQRLIGPNLKSVTKGQLAIDGTNVSVKGDVQNEATRQQLVSEMATNLNPTYVVKNSLRVAVAEQVVLDQTLANRIVEFESGSATFTPKGQAVLDEMANVLRSMSGRRFEVIGYTDNLGSYNANVALSKARSDAVKTYLANKGIDGNSISALGMGPDNPVASNNTPDGRARNRRIEFRVMK